MARLKIGIDLRVLQKDYRFHGIGMYVRCLLAAFSELDHNNSYYLYQWPGKELSQELNLSKKFDHHTRYLKGPRHRLSLRGIKNLLWHRLDKQGLDAYLQTGLAYGRPYGKVPVVGILYDVIPILFRTEYFPAATLSGSLRMATSPKRWLVNYLGWHNYRWQLKQLRKSQHIISISQSAKQDFLKYSRNLSARKITAIPLAYDKAYSTVIVKPAVIQKYTLNQPFFIFVGGVDLRKNVYGLLTAFQAYKENGGRGQLALVGKDFDTNTKFTNPSVNEFLAYLENYPQVKDVKQLGYVPTEDLRHIYGAAIALVAPSLYEGFGITLLEAMACSCPVIALNNSSIPEVAGKAAMLLDKTDQLPQAMEQLATDKSLREKMKGVGLKQAQKFSWRETAAKTLAVLTKVAQDEI